MVYTTSEVRLTFILLSNPPRLHSIRAHEFTGKIKEHHNYSYSRILDTRSHFFYLCRSDIFNLFKIDCHNNDRDDNAIAVGGPSLTRIIQLTHTPW